MTEIYAPGQRSPSSGRLAHAEPPGFRLDLEVQDMVPFLDARPPGVYELPELAYLIARDRFHPGMRTPRRGDRATMLAVLAAAEYRGGGLTRSSSRRDLDHAALMVAGAPARNAADHAVTVAMRHIDGPASLREIQRRIRSGANSAILLRGCLDRLRMAGTVVWLSTDPLPWGRWDLTERQGEEGRRLAAELVERTQAEAAEAASEQRRLDEAVAKMDAMVAEAYGLSAEELAEWGQPPVAGFEQQNVGDAGEHRDPGVAAVERLAERQGAGDRPRWEPPVDAQQWREAGDALERQFRERAPRGLDPRLLRSEPTQVPALGLFHRERAPRWPSYPSVDAALAAEVSAVPSEPSQVPDPVAFGRERAQTPESGA